MGVAAEPPASASAKGIEEGPASNFEIEASLRSLKEYMTLHHGGGRRRHNDRASRGGRGSNKRRRVRFKIPPTIHEVDEEEATREFSSTQEDGASIGGDGARPLVRNTKATLASHVAALQRRNRLAGGGEYPHAPPYDADYDSDSSSDASAKTYDSLRVNTNARVREGSRHAHAHAHHHHHHHHHDRASHGAGDPKGRGTRHRSSTGAVTSHRNPRAHRQGRGGQLFGQYSKVSKVQTIVRILDRIGSGSSFTSSEGPSDSSKHSMKMWEQMHHHPEESAGAPSGGEGAGGGGAAAGAAADAAAGGGVGCPPKRRVRDPGFSLRKFFSKLKSQSKSKRTRARHESTRKVNDSAMGIHRMSLCEPAGPA